MKQRRWTMDVNQIYGPQSERICRQFQSEKRLTVDGRVGPKTWDASWTAPIT
jgi:peptidoglycan hydrolase-like protein with peptidoglycan-binding domain